MIDDVEEVESIKDVDGVESVEDVDGVESIKDVDEVESIEDVEKNCVAGSKVCDVVMLVMTVVSEDFQTGSALSPYCGSIKGKTGH